MMMIPRKDFFESVFDDEPMFSRREARVMKTDIKEKDGNYVFTIDVPGVEKENIDIDLENGYLTVSAKIKNEISESDESEKYIHQERYTGEFARSYYVGEEVKDDDIKASFKNGTLIITVPAEKEKEVETKKRIQID